MLRQMLDNEEWHKHVYMIALYLSYVITGASILGMQVLPVEYANLIATAVQSYVAMFLVVRFWPFGRNGQKFDDFDKRIAFSAGVTIAATLLPVHRALISASSFFRS